MKRNTESPDEAPRGERLQKVLAAAGIGSRRQCEEFITAGRVEVDREVVTELGTRVDPLQQEIRVDGEAIRKPHKLYFAVNKPVGVVTTNFDPSGRSRVIDLVPTEERVFAVGRLDRSSEGLILVTNDGEFANRLTHPRYGVEKTYLVRIAGSAESKQLERLKKGVHLAEGYARAQSITVKKHHGQSTDLIIVLNEGRNREIRRIFARVGHKVLAIKRIAVGNIKLGDLPVGASRRLLTPEVEGLLQLAKQNRRTTKKPASKSAPAGSATEGKPRSAPKISSPADDQYVQKQALLAQPLSLDDLLRDDLDEGPLPPLGTPDLRTEGLGDDENMDVAETQGGVIEYDDDFSFSPTPRAPRPAGPGKRRPGAGGSRRPQSGQRAPRSAKTGYQSKRPGFQNRRQSDQEGPPRESFGKKRGGKRSFGAIEGSRGAVGDKAGKFRSRPKHKKKDERPHGADNQRRGQRRGAAKGTKQFGKPGGKRKGRR
jgi:23S rRNA pseudouridine2605 synthase